MLDKLSLKLIPDDQIGVRGTVPSLPEESDALLIDSSGDHLLIEPGETDVLLV